MSVIQDVLQQDRDMTAWSFSSDPTVIETH